MVFTFYEFIVQVTTLTKADAKFIKGTAKGVNIFVSFGVIMINNIIVWIIKKSIDRILKLFVILPKPKGR